MKKEWKRRWKAGLATVFTLSLAVTQSGVQSLAVQAAETTGAKSTVTAEVYPKPQKIVLDAAQGMRLQGTVDIVAHGEQVEAMLPKLKAVLQEQGIACRESEELSADRASIFITSDKDHCEVCGSVTDSENVLAEAQGYVLKTDDSANAKGQVTITGADADGAYYGVLTLGQLLEQKSADGTFAKATVSDYPSIKLRGFVEGFYGYPWSFEDRMSLIQETSEYKMNTYIYAPKDDPYHKDQWRDPYPEEEAAHIRSLAEEADKNNMSFCWNIHPGNGFNYSTEDDYNALIAKFEQLYGLGVRQFGISYDDLASGYSGPQHVSLINKVDEEFVKTKKDVKPLIVVGTRYCNGWGPDMGTYFKPFLTDLNEDVVIMWTGANTMSDITKAAYDWPKQTLGISDARDLAAWWNYPVNDYCDGNLMMSPLENLYTDVDNLSGFFLNPMSQADASKVAIFSGADYSWNVAGFEAMNSWKTSIQKLVPEANEAFERFADNISYIKDGFEFDESRYLVDKITALNDAVEGKTGISEAVAALKAEFETMRTDAAALRKLHNTNLQEEINPFLDAYEVLAEAGIAGMEAYDAALAGDFQATLDKLNLMNEKLDETETFTVESLETDTTKINIVKVGEKRIKPMLREAQDQVMNVLLMSVNPEVACSVFSSSGAIAGKEVAVGEETYTVEDLQLTLEAGGYVGFNLPGAELLTEISMETAQSSSLEIQTSLNGVIWESMETTVENGVLKTTGSAIAAYVRAFNKGTSAVNAAIKNFRVSTAYDPGSPTASTNMGTWETNNIRNAVDGNIKTKYWSNSASNVNDYVRVDFENEFPLYDLKICYGVDPKGVDVGLDGFGITRLEVSTDGTNWKQIGADKSKDSYVVETINGQEVASVKFNAQGETVRNIRFTAVQPNGEQWVQVYEVFYNQNPVTLSEASFDVYDITYLYDGNFNTFVSTDSVKAGDYLTYKMTTHTNIEALTIIQDPDRLCGAAVSVRKLDGTWKEIGSLDEQVSVLDVNDSITEVKMSFDPEKPAPRIYEIMLKAKETVDKSALQTAIREHENMNLKASDFEKAYWDAYQAALNTAKTVAADDNATQSQVAVALSALAEKYKEMIRSLVNQSDLQAKVDAAKALKESDYTATSWAALKEALNAAEAVLNSMDADQKQVDDALSVLNGKMSALVQAGDKTALQEKVNEGKALKSSAYTATSWSAFKEALDAADEVLNDNDAVQSQVNEALSALTQKMDALVQAGNKTELRAKVNEGKALQEADYISAGWSAFKDALDAAETVVSDKDADQARVDEALSVLTEKMNALVKAANKTALQEKIDEYAGLKQSDYTAATWEAFQAVLNEVKSMLSDADATQEKADRLLASLAEKFNALEKVLAPSANKIALQAALDACKNLNQADYTPESWNAFAQAYQAALNAVATADDAALKSLLDSLTAAQKALVPVTAAQPDVNTTVSKNVKYRILNKAKKTAAVVSGTKKNAKNAVIAATVKIGGVNYKVVQIDDKAFKGYSKLQSVTIGKNVKTIGKQSFYSCKKLKKITLKGTDVKTIKKNAFKNTNAKMTVSVPKKLKKNQRNTLLRNLKKQGMSKKAVVK